jgi:hypothetical protein
MDGNHQGYLLRSQKAKKKQFPIQGEPYSTLPSRVDST